MTIKLGMTFPTVAYGNVRLDVEAGTVEEARSKLFQMKAIMDEIFGVYQEIQEGPPGAVEKAIEVLNEGLGVTVLDESSESVKDPDTGAVAAPPPSGDEAPFWARKTETSQAPKPATAMPSFF